MQCTIDGEHEALIVSWRQSRSASAHEYRKEAADVGICASVDPGVHDLAENQRFGKLCTRSRPTEAPPLVANLLAFSLPWFVARSHCVASHAKDQKQAAGNRFKTDGVCEGFLHRTRIHEAFPSDCSIGFYSVAWRP